MEASLPQSDRTKMNVIRHPSEQHPVDPVYTHVAFADWFPKQGPRLELTNARAYSRWDGKRLTDSPYAVSKGLAPVRTKLKYEG